MNNDSEQWHLRKVYNAVSLLEDSEVVDTLHNNAENENILCIENAGFHYILILRSV